LDLQIGYINQSIDNPDFTTFNIDYSYNNYLLSYAKTFLNDLNYIDSSYLGAGYIFDFDTYSMKVYLGEYLETKQTINTLDLDYFYNNSIYSISLNDSDIFSYSSSLTYVIDSYILNLTYLNGFTNNLDFSTSYNLTNNTYLKLGYNQDINQNSIYNSYIVLGISFE
jgi:hypothetical protein